MADKPGFFGRLRAAAMSKTTVVKTFSPDDPNAVAKMAAENANTAGQLVTPETALTLSTVWACVRLIAESLAMLPLHLLHLDEEDPRKATRHALYPLLAVAPNSKSTPAVFWESVLSAMLLQGNAYVHKKKSRDGRLVSLVFMDPNRLTVTRDWRYGPKRFHYYGNDGVQREIPAAEVWHIPGYSLDGIDGISVIEKAAQVFGSALAAEKSAARTFLNGMLQAVYYKVAAFLTDQQRDDFRKHVKGTVERGEAPILEGGVDVQSLGIKPQDAQLLQSRAFSVEEICRWFRVPPHMVGHSEKSTAWGSGLESQTLGFLTYTLRPWMVRIEQAISIGLLDPGERAKYHAKFDVESLLQMDSAAMANYLGTMVNKGLMKVNEARRKMGLPPLSDPNADKLLVQGAMVLLESLTPEGNAKQVKQPKDALEAAQAQFQEALQAMKGG